MGLAVSQAYDSLVVDGLPPIARGSTQPGHDNEVRMLKLFPSAGFLIEKPISIASFEEVDKVREALQGRIVSVGYMLRYLKGKLAAAGYGADHAQLLERSSRFLERACS